MLHSGGDVAAFRWCGYSIQVVLLLHSCGVVAELRWAVAAFRWRRCCCTQVALLCTQETQFLLQVALLLLSGNTNVAQMLHCCCIHDVLLLY